MKSFNKLILMLLKYNKALLLLWVSFFIISLLQWLGSSPLILIQSFIFVIIKTFFNILFLIPTWLVDLLLSNNIIIISSSLTFLWVFLLYLFISTMILFFYFSLLQKILNYRTERTWITILNSFKNLVKGYSSINQIFKEISEFFKKAPIFVWTIFTTILLLFFVLSVPKQVNFLFEKWFNWNKVELNSYATFLKNKDWVKTLNFVEEETWKLIPTQIQKQKFDWIGDIFSFWINQINKNEELTKIINSVKTKIDQKNYSTEEVKNRIKGVLVRYYNQDKIDNSVQSNNKKYTFSDYVDDEIKITSLSFLEDPSFKILKYFQFYLYNYNYFIYSADFKNLNKEAKLKWSIKQRNSTIVILILNLNKFEINLNELIIELSFYFYFWSFDCIIE